MGLFQHPLPEQATGTSGSQPRDAAGTRALTEPSKSGPGTGQKLRGGYYTPPALAEFLAEWAITSADAMVLEPSAGDGGIISSAVRRLGPNGRVYGVELDPVEARKASGRVNGMGTVVNGDFFSWFLLHRPDGTFDAVLGNPPFIRYHDFPEEHRSAGFMIMREVGLHPSRLTNAWLPFVVAATRALRPGGRLALVLPAELLQVTYAGELRQYLAREYEAITIFTFRQLVFSGIQQETILVLGSRRSVGDFVPKGAARMTFVELDGLNDLAFHRETSEEPVEMDLRHAREKWTQYYLSPKELGLIRDIERCSSLGKLGDVAEVDVGIVTGRNAFFVLTLADAIRYDVLPFCRPLVGRSSQIAGITLSPEDWEEICRRGERCLLLQLGDTDRSDLPPSAIKYVERGEAEGFHLGYKCALRLPKWWNVPSVWTPDAFLLRQIHLGPKIVENRTKTTCTDTIHRIRTKNGVDRSWLAVSSMNSLTFAFSEIRGRSYGGGVLALSPSPAFARCLGVVTPCQLLSCQPSR